MKIVGISGSLRKGNTEFLLRTILDKAKELGAQTDLILLRESNVEFCRSCDDLCSNSGKCIINDDMQKIYEKLINADVIIFGTPTYFDDISGLLKNFLDRLNPVGFGRKLKGKDAYAIAVGGAGQESAKRAIESLRIFCKVEEMNFIDSLQFKVYKADDASKNEIIIEECNELAEDIMSKNI